MESIIQNIGVINTVYQEEFMIDMNFTEIASHFSDIPGTTCLLSGGDLDCARYHILATKPWLTFYGSGNEMHIETSENKISINANPLDILKKILSHFSLSHLELPPPISTGLFGYLSYDLKDSIEIIPNTTINDLQLPDIYFTAPSIVFIMDKKEETKTIYIPEFLNNKDLAEQTLSWFKNILFSENPNRRPFNGGTTGFKSNFERPTYMDAIDKIKEYIKSGDIYQVNMSQRFITDFTGDAFELFKYLYRINPAPFFAFLNCNNHQIVSTSPERFIKLDGDNVETRPIKGTRPRGLSPDDDALLKSELQNSKKDDAELSMIVDLMRNDIGKVCKSGSVKVTEHKRVEAYKNVFHLISVVEGILDDKYDGIDIIKATFPGGSITGCPKIRSMEIIDELESNKRHIYTGSIGYISFHDTMDFSIAIRTATIINNHLIFSVGGGVVYDSDPSDEYDETLHKGQTLLNAFSNSSASYTNTEFAWENGLIKPLFDISIPVNDPGFYYGLGFFETIKVDNGSIQFLEEHITRLKVAWDRFYDNPFPTLSFKTIIDNLIISNNLQSTSVAVKIITTIGASQHPPYNNKIIITAKKYIHRLALSGKNGIELILYPKKRHTFLADYKSLNYLFYFDAGNYAKVNGGDEALILNADGSISETNTANIILIQDSMVLLPESDHVLPGVTIQKEIKKLKATGYIIKSEKVYPDDIYNYDHVLITNSLIGVVPIISLNGKVLKDSGRICELINSKF